MTINSSNFFKSNPVNGTVKISFLVSTIRLNLEIGSDESIKFLDSLLKSSNTEIFKTKFIQTILYDKWNHISWIPYLNGIISVIYQISLSVYIVKKDYLYLEIAFGSNILLFIYEIIQMIIDLIEYWKDFWNYINITLAGFFFVYFYFVYIELQNKTISTEQTTTNTQYDYS